MRFRSKYGARKTVVDGIRFDSRAEARRFQELQLLVAAGEITDLELQPRYVLQEAFTWRGKRIRPITYTADFRYREQGRVVVEDVKGMRTRDYVLRKKLFMRRYPDVDFREVRA